MEFDSAAAAAALGWFLIVVCWLLAAFLLAVGAWAAERSGALVSGLCLLGLAIYLTAGAWPW